MKNSTKRFGTHLSKKVSPKNNRWILLTGLSGSGKTTALKVLEDQGYSVIDNLPASLLPTLMDLLQTQGLSGQKFVLGTDVRRPDFLTSFSQLIEMIKKTGAHPEVFFLDSQKKTLLRRFSETRRPHPLQNTKTSLTQAVQKEVRQLRPLRKIATKIFDTTDWNVHQLKRALLNYLSLSEELPPMTLTLLSFGYKFGIPPEADMIFDVRFIKNPYFEPRLKNRPGTSQSVKNFLNKQKDTQQFLQHTHKFLKFLIPKFKMEGKANLTIGIGCTGGRHRSVAIVEFLEENLGSGNVDILKVHRDLVKGR